LARKSLGDNKNIQTGGQSSPPDSSIIEDRIWTKDFICIWIINLALSVWGFMIQAPFPFYIIHLGGSELLVGITAGAVSVAALLMRPFAGWFLDNVSRSILFFAGALLIIIASALLYFIPVLGVVIFLRIIFGLSHSGTTTASATNAVDAIPAKRFGEGLGFLGLGNTLGTALGPALGLAIIGGIGFPPLFIVSGALMVVALLASKGFSFRKISITKRKAVKLSSLFNKDAVPASVVLLLSSVPFGGVVIFVALYGEYYGIGHGAWYFVLLSVGTGTARLVTGRMIDKYGEQPMMIFGNGCFVLALVFLVLGSSAFYYLSGLFFGFGFGVLNPSMQAMAMRIIPPEKRGSATSTFQCSFDISGGIGGIIAGWLVTVWGYRQMFGAMIIFIVISAIAYAFWAAKTPSAFKVYNKNKPLS